MAAQQPRSDVMLRGVERYWVKGRSSSDRLALRPLAGGKLDELCPEPLLTAAAWGACLMHPQQEGMMVSSSLVPGSSVVLAP